MTVKNRDQVGWIDCPMCEVTGTVHESKIGRGGKKAVKYWRCSCGCIQPWAPAGQAFIDRHMRPLDPVQVPADPPADPPADDGGEPVQETKRRGLLGDLVEFLSESE